MSRAIWRAAVAALCLWTGLALAMTQEERDRAGAEGGLLLAGAVARVRARREERDEGEGGRPSHAVTPSPGGP